LIPWAPNFGTELQGSGNRLPHGPSESDPPFQLGGHVLCNELCIQLRFANFENVQEDFLLRVLLQLLPEPVDLGAFLADHDAGAGGVDVDLHLQCCALDIDLREVWMWTFTFSAARSISTLAIPACCRFFLI